MRKIISPPVFIFFGIFFGFLLEVGFKRGDVSMVVVVFLTTILFCWYFRPNIRETVVFTDPETGLTRRVDISQKCCPKVTCTCYGQKNIGNLQIRRIYGKRKDRLLLRCHLCGTEFSETRNTAYYNVKKPLQTFFSVLQHLSYSDGIRDTARKTGIHRDTVLAYLRRAGKQCEKLDVFLVGLKCIEIQLDELWSFIKKKKKNLKDIEEYLAGFGDRWTWLAFDPVSKFVIAHVSGKRVEEMCKLLLERVKERVDSKRILFTSDELKCYATWILEVFGKVVTFPRTGRRGRPKKSIKVPGKDLLYATVHKTREKGRIIKVEKRIIFGEDDEIQKILKKSPVSNHVNTSFVERKNLDIRQKNKRMTRKTQSFSKKPETHDQQMEFTLAFGNFCRVHSTTKMTPAVAIGITDHTWSLEEFMSLT